MQQSCTEIPIRQRWLGLDRKNITKRLKTLKMDSDAVDGYARINNKSLQSNEDRMKYLPNKWIIDSLVFKTVIMIV